ncbi:SPOSA6832_00570 [Sporobolomyces salmonicolor]|uniref:Pre-rRNA-processing protein RIX1 n=1 Tax=Sporidiobolus salmonicolor TaxID=5005 RepID=A0A0D6EGN6_SPOSA|nr:SPOSA6832_00570 [Sporobolomyces salmonicolor]
MATAILSHLLAHHLAANDDVPAALPHVLDVLSSHRVVSQAEREEGANGPVLHRWQMRLTSLISPSLAPAVRAAGFQLLHLSFSSSTSLLLASAKATLSNAQAVLASSPSKVDPALFGAALELTKLVIAKSTWHPEWARENVGAPLVQKVVNGLVQAATADSVEVRLQPTQLGRNDRLTPLNPQIKLPSLSAIVTLLPLFPTALRPLSPALHTLAISLLCAPAASPALIDAGASLFVALYLLAPKGKEGLREAWKTGVEALVGTVDGLLSQATSGIFAEDTTYNHTLAPLALPPLEDSSPISALSRLETLSRVLNLALRTPTTEKAGTVQVPVGALVELGVRMVGMNTEMPVKERVDPTVQTLTMSLLPRIQVIGCQLLAQLGLCVGSQLVMHASAILSTVARTLSTYPTRSPMRPALSTTYSLLLSSLGAAVDPDEGKKSLARVWRSVLEDIGSVALEPVVVANAGTDREEGRGPDSCAGGQDKSRKAKRQKTYDPSESMTAKRVALDELDLEIAERGLSTLQRLLLCPASSFLPPSLQLSTSRLLFYLSLSPQFFTAAPLASTSSSFFPATSASTGLEIAKQSAVFRRGVVGCLKAVCESGVGGVGTEERAVEVWRRGAMDWDAEIKLLSLSALSAFSSLIHPSLPPQQLSTSLLRAQHERKGGFIGDEMDYRETAEEFRLRVEEEREHGEDKEESGDVQMEEEAVVSSMPATSFTASLSSSTSTTAAPALAPTSTGFSSFAAPSFGSVKPVLVAPSPAATQPEAPTPAPALSFSTETAISRTTTKRKVELGGGGAAQDSDEDDDEMMMPSIDMGEDEE